MGTSAELWQIFSEIYDEMCARKQFNEEEDMLAMAKIQSSLCPSRKMQVFVCEHNSVPISAIILSAIGDFGIYIHGATSNEGLKHQGNNLLHWTGIQWLKERGCRWYDLNGVDPVKNPGGFRFKWKMIERFGYHSTFHAYEACERAMSSSIVHFAESAKKGKQQLTSLYKSARKPK